jgi:hypothetical protein
VPSNSKLLVACSCLVASACGRTTVSLGGDDEPGIGARPESLVFDPTEVGETSSSSIEVFNRRRSRATVELATTGPFSAQETVTVGARKTVRVPVEFSPREVGAADGELALTSDAKSFDAIDLAGLGIEPCGGCDDGNACTTDACIDDVGCSHQDVSCPPAEDACRVSQCNPQVGCVEAVAPDGTTCGTNECGGTNACRSGECATGDPNSRARVVAQWDFDTGTSVVFDGSGREHHGMLVAGTRTSTPRGNGVANTGDGLLVDVVDHPDMAFAGSFTVQAWVVTGPNTPTGQEAIVFRGDAREGLDPFILSLQPTGAAQVLVSGPEDGMLAVASAPVPVGVPVQLTAVFDAAAREVRLYLQCALAEAVCADFEQPMRELDENSSPGIGLGSHAGRGGMIYAFRGVLDEVRLYDGVLSTAEISASCDP